MSAVGLVGWHVSHFARHETVESSRFMFFCFVLNSQNTESAARTKMESISNVHTDTYNSLNHSTPIYTIIIVRVCYTAD